LAELVDPNFRRFTTAATVEYRIPEGSAGAAPRMTAAILKTKSGFLPKAATFV
jgi:hypothetical protein